MDGGETGQVIFLSTIIRLSDNTKTRKQVKLTSFSVQIEPRTSRRCQTCYSLFNPLSVDRVQHTVFQIQST
jgi:hypothetical protein